MTTNTPEAAEALARRRAGRKMGWYIHAMVYIAVNIGLAALAGLTGRNWAVYPALGWGMGLLIHALLTFIALPGGSLHERLVQQERQRLALPRDPW